MPRAPRQVPSSSSCPLSALGLRAHWQSLHTRLVGALLRLAIGVAAGCLSLRDIAALPWCIDANGVADRAPWTLHQHGSGGRAAGKCRRARVHYNKMEGKIGTAYEVDLFIPRIQHLTKSQFSKSSFLYRAPFPLRAAHCYHKTGSRQQAHPKIPAYLVPNWNSPSSEVKSVCKQ